MEYLSVFSCEKLFPNVYVIYQRVQTYSVKLVYLVYIFESMLWMCIFNRTLNIIQPVLGQIYLLN